MKITGLECWKQDFILTEPYTIAYETIDRCTNVFLKIQTNNGYTGWGCAAPDMAITGETGDSVLDNFSSIIEPYLIGKSPFNYALILRDLKQLLTKSSTALAMVDMAMYDLISKKADVPLYLMLGGFRKSISTSVTLGILPVKQTLERARELFHKGFKIIKVKGGINIEEDIERLVKMRAALGKELVIRFDANQGYSVSDSIYFTEKTAEIGVEILEQPTSKDFEHRLGDVKNHSDLPVMADESLKTVKDAFRLTSRDLIDMVNIKLMKVGGISEAIQINSVAASAGVESMVGCLDESSLAISAGLHFALSKPNVLYADLDSFLDIRDDPFSSAFILKEGVLYPNSMPGLGIS